MKLLGNVSKLAEIYCILQITLIQQCLYQTKKLQYDVHTPSKKIQYYSFLQSVSLLVEISGRFQQSSK